MTHVAVGQLASKGLLRTSTDDALDKIDLNALYHHAATLLTCFANETIAEKLKASPSVTESSIGISRMIFSTIRWLPGSFTPA